MIDPLRRAKENDCVLLEIFVCQFSSLKSSIHSSINNANNQNNLKLIQ